MASRVNFAQVSALWPLSLGDLGLCLAPVQYLRGKKQLFAMFEGFRNHKRNLGAVSPGMSVKPSWRHTDSSSDS